ncbi:UDP-glucose 4-epimerase GalE [Methanobrevibacter sp. DSM 116169]|uniref:UDP-glucose 4-epimerase GalE n=1 Tax=Methanobrevibacter sp. DSM 116169 TaxID=3242727 RepID=UPI0038FC3FB7
MILVTGGAGYIGSHTNKALNKAGYDTVVLDNLAKGYESFVKWGEFVNGDIGSYDDLKNLFNLYDIEGVIHFAAFSSVAESVEHPAMYLKNNYKNTLNLLKVMREFSIENFIFSSTAAVYGNPKKTPISENHELKPINPYGQSKFIVEQALEREKAKENFNYVSLRYFNAAGADFDLEIGELHEPETHLIPLILDAAIGKRNSISIYGDDYNTPDGTCIRDYIHVNDLADAHIKSYEYLLKNKESNIFNLGNGNGFSVKEVIDTCKRITNVDFNVEIAPRRDGDPDTLIADFKKINDTLNWQTEYDLDTIVESAWNWHKKINRD